MINAFCKSLTGEKALVKALWKLFYTTVGIVSSIYAFSSFLREVGITDKLELFVKSKIWWIVILSTCISFFIHREKLSYSCRVESSDLQIEICVRDIFFIRADSYVIPTNTFFCTKMDNDYISSKSVQGRFQNKYFKNKNQDLNNAIVKSLKEQGFKGFDNENNSCDDRRYPVGTVAKVDLKGKHYYFVSISDVNEFGKPINQHITNIDKALDGLTEAIDCFGYCDDLCIPLMGTGKAAIKEASIEAVFRKTVDIFVNNPKKVSRKLIICINPKDYTDGRADISRLKKYLEYRCEF